MNWLNIELSTLRSPEYLGSDPEQRATWLNLMAYCADQENGGRIELCSIWKDRMWQQVCGVTSGEVDQPSELWSWEGDDLVVLFYPIEKEEEVKVKREAGSKGGKSQSDAKANAARINGAKHSTQAEPKQNPSQGANGKERNGIGSRKEIKEKVADAPVVFPQALDCEEFKVHWDAYIAYRREAKLKTLKPVSVTRQLSEMATWGVERSIQAINTTIAKGWQGIFEPKAGFGTPKPDSTPRKADGSIDYYADAVAVFGEENVVRVAAL
jgi:hypothetical protein